MCGIDHPIVIISTNLFCSLWWHEKSAHRFNDVCHCAHVVRVSHSPHRESKVRGLLFMHIFVTFAQNVSQWSTVGKFTMSIKNVHSLNFYRLDLLLLRSQSNPHGVHSCLPWKTFLERHVVPRLIAARFAEHVPYVKDKWSMWQHLQIPFRNWWLPQLPSIQTFTDRWVVMCACHHLANFQAKGEEPAHEIQKSR